MSLSSLGLISLGLLDRGANPALHMLSNGLLRTDDIGNGKALSGSINISSRSGGFQMNSRGGGIGHKSRRGSF